MPFDSGAISFTRFKVVGDAPKAPDEAMLERFSALALREEELTSNEVEYGWCGGRHVMDEQFNFAHNVFSECFSIGLRIDTNKVPSEIKKAYVALEEQQGNGHAGSRAAKKLA
ncbi:MAG TPA: hypothetical protein PK402_12795, partial [Tepidisphaeraceae bacterium]|nr:hypothetical protein [Tepidisphaeraceae bacterium]